MPHIIIKHWPGPGQEQKQRLTEVITQGVMEHLGSGEQSISVAFEEVSAEDWKEQVYQPDILAHPERLLKKPGYSM
ncbi:MAG: tautomerase family protein [Planctomycetes bacterium]|nr:tautomerase family protein [Planctomycetota bacterium]